MTNKLFLSIIKENFKETFFAALSKIIFALSITLMSYSLTLMFDSYNKSREEFYKSILLVASIVVMTVLLSLISDYFKSKYIKATNKNLKLKMTDSIVDNSYDLIAIRNTGKSISWFLNDADQIENQAFSNFINFIQMVTLVVSSLIAIVVLHWSIALFSIALLIISLIIPTVTQRYIIEAQNKYTIANEKFTESARDNLEGLSVFYIGNALTTFQKNMRTATSQKEEQYYKFSMTKAKIGCTMLSLSLLSQIGVIVFALYVASLGWTTAGSVLSVASLAGNLFNVVQGLTSTITTFKAADVLLNKFKKEKEELKIEFTDRIDKISIENLLVSYDDNKIFENYSFEFKKGKKYAIIGESGSGKSTLLKIIVALVKPESGKIKINNLKINDIDLRKYYQKIAYIEQNVYLINGTIRDNITLGAKVSEEKLSEVIEKVQLGSFIKNQKNGLDSIVTSNGQGISGGEKQRIALARALVKDVDFILIDESTSQLDKSTRDKIEETILGFKDIGLISVSHNTDVELLQLFDEVINSADFRKISAN